MRLQVGGVYEFGRTQQVKVIYTCLEECEATTVRFKEKVRGYRLLVLAVDFPDWWGSKPTDEFTKAGDTFVIPEGSHMTVGVARLD